MHFAPWRTVRGRLLAVALMVEMVMLAMLVGNSLRLLREAMGAQAVDQAEQVSPVLVAALVAPLAQFDYATVQAVLDESHAIRGIDYVAVLDNNGHLVAASGWPLDQSLPPADPQLNLEESPPRYDVARPILLAGQSLGTLRFGLDLTRIVDARHNLLQQGMAIAGGELLLSAGLLSLLGLLITRQLSLLTAASLKVAQGQPTLEPVPEGQDDVGRLGAAFNVMSRAITERVEQLTRARDETERMAQSLHERNAQLDAIFALSPDGFVSFDADNRVTFASPAFFRMTGLVHDAVLGHDEDHFSAQLAALCTDATRFPGVAAMKERIVAQAVDAAQHGGQASAPPERLLIELSGSPRRVVEVGLRLSTAEEVSQILIFADVTHETEVDRMKSEFLSHAAHELRTPMASIFGFTEILRTRPVTDAKRQDVLDIIHRQSQRMMTIIDELLDLVRIDARRGKDLVFESVDVAALLREAVHDFGVPTGREPIVLEGADTPQIVRGDAAKLQQAMRNVLSNAYKYSPGGGEVRAWLVHERQGEVDRLGLRVSDQGLGMTAEQVARVCERFFRADTSGNIPGTGLGMSIVKEIIDMHGGELQIESVPGQGTRVTIWLTLEAAAA